MNLPPNLRSLSRVRPSGFTLMELMLVLGIISILIVAGVKMGPLITRQAKQGSAKAQIATISGMITAYQSSNSGRLPTSIDQMISKGILDEGSATDPWGNKYQLVVPSRRSKEKYDLFSQGMSVEDETDDVGNWDE
jgi:general secretion pathway protein G